MASRFNFVLAITDAISVRWQHLLAALRCPPRGGNGDLLFRWLTLPVALSVVAILVMIVGEFLSSSRLSVQAFGWRSLFSSDWGLFDQHFGGLPLVLETLVTSLLALLLAAFVSLGAAVFVRELAPRWLSQPLAMVIDLLAAIPSVVFGLGGIFLVIPWLQEQPGPALPASRGTLPLPLGTMSAGSQLAAGMIVVLMIVPLITSLAGQILGTVPRSQREGAYALGATRWEVTRIAVLSSLRNGLVGALILGLGRALGETVAVTMVIGSGSGSALSLFVPGPPLASVVVNEFAGANSGVYRGALFEVGLVLLGVTVLVNALARRLLKASCCS